MTIAANKNLAKRSVAAAETDEWIVPAGDIASVYLTLRPPAGAPPEVQARALWSAVAAALAEHEAFVMEERVFLARADALPLCRAIRAEYMAPYDGGVAPTWLVAPRDDADAMSGVTIRAVAGGNAPETLRFKGRAVGRQWAAGDYTMITGVSFASAGSDAPSQAHGMWAKADAFLSAAGAQWDDVTRTWLWLRDIHSWYGALNEVRHALFRARGLLGVGNDVRLPASTGIGIAPADGGYCTMDLIAETGAKKRRIGRTKRQGAAVHYGSAFSRALTADTPLGRVVYVSGTASIGLDGQTRHVGDARAQIEETLQCVRTALSEAAGAKESNIVQALVYCQTAEVERIFRREFFALGLPCLILRADICRPDLLFEIECTAIP